MKENLKTIRNSLSSKFTHDFFVSDSAKGIKILFYQGPTEDEVKTFVESEKLIDGEFKIDRKELAKVYHLDYTNDKRHSDYEKKGYIFKVYPFTEKEKALAAVALLRDKKGFHARAYLWVKEGGKKKEIYVYYKKKAASVIKGKKEDTAVTGAKEEKENIPTTESEDSVE